MKALGLFAFLVFAGAAYGQQLSPVVDAQGDAQALFGKPPPLHDIDQVDVWYDDDFLYFRVDFWNEISAPSAVEPTTTVYGFFEIDVDRNPLTGSSSIHDVFFGPVLPGAEYYLDFSFTETLHPGQIAVCEYTSPQEIGLVDVVYGNRYVQGAAYGYIEGAIPLLMLGGADGQVHFAWMAGAAEQPTDGLSVYGISRVIPEPAGLLLLGLAAPVVLRRARGAGAA